MNELSFSEFWSYLFSWFDIIIEYAAEVANWIQKPVNTILVPNENYADIINRIINLLNSLLPNTSVFALMFGIGLSFFLGVTVIKYFLDLIK